MRCRWKQIYINKKYKGSVEFKCSWCNKSYHRKKGLIVKYCSDKCHKKATEFMNKCKNMRLYIKSNFGIKIPVTVIQERWNDFAMYKNSLNSSVKGRNHDKQRVEKLICYTCKEMFTTLYKVKYKHKEFTCCKKCLKVMNNE